MGLFGKKKKKKKEEEEEKEEEQQPKKKKKKKPRKKRKTPPKPWTRKERVILAIILIGTILVSAYLSIRARGWDSPKLPKLSMPEINTQILGEETIVIGDDNKVENIGE